MKKKVLKAITIAILLLIGLVTIGFVYLFLIPNSSLFGVRFLGKATNKTSERYDVSQISTIELNSNNFNISVLETDSNEVYVNVISKVYGLVLVKNSKLEFSYALNDGLFKIELTEPHGLVSYKNSSINLYVPKTSNLNLILKNNSANVSIDNTLSFKDFSYTSENGSCSLTKCSINGNLNLNLNKSTFTINEDVTLNSNDVNLKVSTGKLVAPKQNFNNINLLENARGVIKINSCKSIVGTFELAGGKIEANTIETINLTSSDTNVVINECLTKTSVIKLTKSGSVNIKNIKSACSILTNSGNINIDKTEIDNSSNILSCESKSGSIKILNANCIVDATTKSGNIQVEYAETCPKYDGDNLNYDSSIIVRRNLFATTESGKITAKNLERVKINISGKGSANITMMSVIGSDNSIKAKSGSVNLKFNLEGEKAFKLSTQTTGSASVNYATYPVIGGSTLKNATYEIYNGYSSMQETTNLIEIESSGSIKVRDSVTENY